MKSSINHLLSILVISVLTGCVYPGIFETPEYDPVDRVAQRYGIDRERVLNVAEELGVDPAEIETFGSYYFPYNYYEYQFELFEQEHGRPPTRSEVEQIVRGYIAKCDYAQTGMAYVYYSEKTHSGHGEIAMVLAISFQLTLPNEPVPEDPLYMGMQPIELWDTSVNPSDSTYWDECIQEYLREN